jgi:hypothetical protein
MLRSNDVTRSQSWNGPGLLHSVRLVASFALLGAVLTGIAVGWVGQLPFDPRIIGAVVGALAAIAGRATHTL